MQLFVRYSADLPWKFMGKKTEKDIRKMLVEQYQGEFWFPKHLLDKCSIHVLIYIIQIHTEIEYAMLSIRDVLILRTVGPLMPTDSLGFFISKDVRTLCEVTGIKQRVLYKVRPKPAKKPRKKLGDNWFVGKRKRKKC